MYMYDDYQDRIKNNIDEIENALKYFDELISSAISSQEFSDEYKEIMLNMRMEIVSFENKLHKLK